MNRYYVKAQLFIFPVEDSVYLPNEEMLQEYILNENGILYQGSWDDITTVPWNFGQVYTCIHIRSNEASVLKCLWSATSLRKCCDLRWHMVRIYRQCCMLVEFWWDSVWIVTDWWQESHRRLVCWVISVSVRLLWHKWLSHKPESADRVTATTSMKN